MNLIGLLAALGIMLLTEGWNIHLKRERKVKYYREEEIMHKADSLLNKWAEEMKRDSI